MKTDLTYCDTVKCHYNAFYYNANAYLINVFDAWLTICAHIHVPCRLLQSISASSNCQNHCPGILKWPTDVSFQFLCTHGFRVHCWYYCGTSHIRSCQQFQAMPMSIWCLNIQAWMNNYNDYGLHQFGSAFIPQNWDSVLSLMVHMKRTQDTSNRDPTNIQWWPL